MHLFWATEDFKLAGQALPGFPLLLWDDMTGCIEANAFLRHYLMRGAIGSRKSWPSTARALYDFYSFLQAHELLWDDVDRGEDKALVAGYRDYCFNVIGLKRNTIRQRLLYICAFYEFAQQRQWISRLPFDYEDRRYLQRRDSYLQHADGARSAEG